MCEPLAHLTRVDLGCTSPAQVDVCKGVVAARCVKMQEHNLLQQSQKLSSLLMQWSDSNWLVGRELQACSCSWRLTCCGSAHIKWHCDLVRVIPPRPSVKLGITVGEQVSPSQLSQVMTTCTLCLADSLTRLHLASVKVGTCGAHTSRGVWQHVDG
jgi:hypothetical protein